jgi:hypothetical protein
MKLKLFTLSILFFVAFHVFAERFDHDDFEKFKAKKVAFITDAINLTPAEAEKFWPVYNEFEKKKFSNMQEHRDLEKSLKEKIDNLPDEKYIELSQKLVSFEKIEGDLLFEYNDKFLKILPPKKVVQLYISEMEFKGFLLREYKKGDHDNPPPLIK